MFICIETKIYPINKIVRFYCFYRFVFKVNNKVQNTDIEANDGAWHHIVVTWTSNRGAWKFYYDGLLFDDGYDLAAGETIKGNRATRYGFAIHS